MPDKPLSPDDWKKFSEGLRSEAAPEVSSEASYVPQVEGALSFGKGALIGADKAIVGMIPESAYNFVGLEGKKYKDFASSPGEGGAESAGEWTGDIAANVVPFALTPELGIAAKGGELLGNLALASRTAGRIGQGLYKTAIGAGKVARGAEKGAVSGAAEAALHNEDAKQAPTEAVKRGGVTGGVTAAEFMAGRLAYEALPPGVKHMVRAGAFGLTAGGAGMFLYDELGRHHWVPHALLYGLAGPLLGVAAGAAKVPPGIVGAGAERAAQGAGYEPSESTSSEPQDEIIGQ